MVYMPQLLCHTLLNGNCNGYRCADHGVVAQRKIAIFIVLICLKKCSFLSKISTFLAKNPSFLPFTVFICFNAFLPEMLN